MRARSAETAVWFGRSRLSSGSSRSRSSGPEASACAISRRCCSPPEQLADRPRGVRGRARRAPSTSATRSRGARPPASGSPQRSPSSPSRTRSTPRIRVEESKRVPLRQVADRGVPASRRLRRGPTRSRARAGSRPSRTRSSVDFPAPFGPRTATSSPGSTASVASSRSSRSPILAAASRSSTRRQVALERSSGSSWSRLPLLERRVFRREGLRDRDDRDVLGPRERGELLDVRRDVLAVEDPDLHLRAAGAAARRSALSDALTSLPSATAFAKPGGVSELQPEARAERLEDALAVADGDAGEAAANLRPQRVVAGEALSLERRACELRSTTRPAGSAWS